MFYRMPLTDGRGPHVTVLGHKTIHDDDALDLWSDITTLSVQVFEGDVAGPEIDTAALGPANAPKALREAIEEVIAGLDSGKLRVAEKAGGEWITHQWIKKAVLLSFRLEDNRVMQGGATRYYDKVASKFDSYDEAKFKSGGFRVVPPAIARRGAFIAKNAVLMPSYLSLIHI